jgi:hypothetical protein
VYQFAEHVSRIITLHFAPVWAGGKRSPLHVCRPLRPPRERKRTDAWTRGIKIFPVQVRRPHAEIILNPLPQPLFTSSSEIVRPSVRTADSLKTTLRGGVSRTVERTVVMALSQSPFFTTFTMSSGVFLASSSPFGVRT